MPRTFKVSFELTINKSFSENEMKEFLESKFSTKDTVLHSEYLDVALINDY